MGSLNDIVDEMRAAPDDDGPRLVWADAVGGERGELVVIQCELERGKLATRDAIKRRVRQRELLARYGAAWSGLAGWARRVSFRRGFVDAAEIELPTFVSRAETVFTHAPMLTALTATDLEVDAIRRLGALYAHPAFRALRGLDITNAETVTERDGFRVSDEFEADEIESHGDAAIEQLVATGGLRHLRAFGIEHSGTSQQPNRLVGARHELERLLLRDFLPRSAVGTLLRNGGLASLRALELSGAHDLVELASLLPPNVVELALDDVDDDGITALAMSPIATRLERLTIRRANIWREQRRFAAFSRLRTLEVHGNFGDDARVFASQAMPALRELAMRVRLDLPSTRLVAESLGPQLELLDLCSNLHALRYVNELKPKVAGALLVGHTGQPRPLLRVGPTTQMAWWDHVLL